MSENSLGCADADCIEHVRYDGGHDAARDGGEPLEDDALQTQVRSAPWKTACVTFVPGKRGPSPALTNGDRDSLVRLLPTGRFNRAGPESAETSGLSQSHSCSAEITLRVS